MSMPEFEGVGRHHAAQAAVAQVALDFPALQRQVAAAIAAHRFRPDRRLAKNLP